MEEGAGMEEGTGMEGGAGMGIWGGWKKGNESANAKINILPIPAKAGISLSTGAGRATLALHRFLLLSESQTTQKKFCTFLEKRRDLIYNGRDVLQNLPF